MTLKGKTGVRPDVVASQIFIYDPILVPMGDKIILGGKILGYSGGNLGRGVNG